MGLWLGQRLISGNGGCQTRQTLGVRAFKYDL